MARIFEMGDQTEQDILEKLRQAADNGCARADISNLRLEPQSEGESPLLKAEIVASAPE